MLCSYITNDKNNTITVTAVRKRTRHALENTDHRWSEVFIMIFLFISILQLSLATDKILLARRVRDRHTAAQ